MSGLRTSLLFAMIAAGAAACSAQSSKGPPLVVCTAGQNGCPSEDSSAAITKSGKTDDPAPTDNSPTPTPSTGEKQIATPVPTSTQPDPLPSSDDGGGGGGSCIALSSCCSALRSAGITGSADSCDSVVSGGDATSCASELAADGMPDDFYDPPAACMN